MMNNKDLDKKTKQEDMDDQVIHYVNNLATRGFLTGLEVSLRQFFILDLIASI